MRPSVAIAHDYLTQRGGAERVVLAIARAFPGATVHTTLYDPSSTFPEFTTLDVRASWLSRCAPLRKHHRAALPLLAPVVSGTAIDAQVVLCSSSGWAHGYRTSGRKVVYCHAPARWLYQSDRYAAGRVTSAAALALLGPPLRRWDQAAARTADRYLVNSSVVAAAVRAVYGIEPEVLAPPVVVATDGPTDRVPGVEPGFWLCVSRLLAYKNVDAVVDAFSELRDERLVLVGDGPEASRIRARAPENVVVAGVVSDAELRWCYVNSVGLVAAAYEDFGLTPVEAAAFGRPVAVLGAGGYLDTVLDGETGVMFDAPTPALIARAVARVRAQEWDRGRLRAHAATFSEARFAARLQAIVGELTD